MNAPWITCRMGKKMSLLAKDEKAYYIIEVGKHLDYATEEWLERQGVSEELLKELNLSFEYIPKKALRGIAIGGYQAGDDLYLYLKSEKRKMTLELDYEEKWIEEFFASIPRFSAPKKKEIGDRGWRKEYQNREIFEKLRYVPVVFLISGLVSGVGWLLTYNKMFYSACLILSILQILLALSWPVYFTIFLPKGKKKQNVWDLEISLWCTGIWLLFGAKGQWTEYDALRWLIPVGISCGLLIYWRAPDMHGEPWAFLTCLLVCCFWISFVAAKINIVYDTTPGESWVLEVEKLHSSGGRRGRNYYCTVTLPDGNAESLNISRSLYLDLDEGDFIRVERNAGALGIEYISAHSLE